MIEIKDSYGFGYRIYDKETGKYIANNSENRIKALFCALLKNELNKPHKTKLHSVEEIGKVYKDALTQSTCDNLNEAVDGFLFYTNYQLKLNHKAFYRNENVIRLVYQVMNDQKDDKKKIDDNKIQALVDDYKYMDKHLISQEKEEKTL